MARLRFPLPRRTRVATAAMMYRVAPELRHRGHVQAGQSGLCDENCTHEPYPPCPVCGLVMDPRWVP